MHGLILASLRDYLAKAHGVAVQQEVVTDEPVYLLGEAYPDERFTTLVTRACEATGRSRDEFLRDFGAFTAEKTFAGLYPALFDLAGSTRPFLLTVEKPIHEVVRVAIPEALPPKLVVSELGENGVSIRYTSPRRLCAMLRGLVEGTALHYGETVRVHERSCMQRGDDACLFEITVVGGTAAPPV